MKHRSLIPNGPYIHPNEEKHGPAPVLVRPSLDVEDVAHGAEFCEADGERNGDGGDPLEQDGSRERRVRCDEPQVVPEPIGRSNRVQNDAGYTKALHRV